MTPQERVDIFEMTDLCTPWSIHVVATLRIADHIAAGITDIDDLAAASGSHSESLGRLLRHLVGKGVFTEPAPGRFALNEPARGLMDSSGALASISMASAAGWRTRGAACSLPCAPVLRPIIQSSAARSGRISRPIRMSQRASTR